MGKIVGEKINDNKVYFTRQALTYRIFQINFESWQVHMGSALQEISFWKPHPPIPNPWDRSRWDHTRALSGLWGSQGCGKEEGRQTEGEPWSSISRGFLRLPLAVCASSWKFGVCWVGSHLGKGQQEKGTGGRTPNIRELSWEKSLLGYHTTDHIIKSYVYII